MTEGLTTFWQEIAQAVAIVKRGTVKRMDGDTWSVYSAGTVIRIDVPELVSTMAAVS